MGLDFQFENCLSVVKLSFGMVFFLGFGICEVIECFCVQCFFLNNMGQVILEIGLYNCYSFRILEILFVFLVKCCFMIFLKSFECFKWV